MYSGMTGKKSDYARRVKLACELGLSECFIKNWMNNHKPKSMRKSIHVQNTPIQLLHQSPIDLQQQLAKQIQMATQINWRYDNNSFISQVNDQQHFSPYFAPQPNSLSTQNASMMCDTLIKASSSLISPYNNSMISQPFLLSPTAEFWSPNIASASTMSNRTISQNNISLQPQLMTSNLPTSISTQTTSQITNFPTNLNAIPGIVSQSSVHEHCIQNTALQQTSLFQPKLGNPLSFSQASFSSRSAMSFDSVSSANPQTSSSIVLDVYLHDSEKHESIQNKLLDDYHSSYHFDKTIINENVHSQHEEFIRDVTVSNNSQRNGSSIGNAQDIIFDRQQSDIEHIPFLEKMFDRPISRLQSNLSNQIPITASEYGADNYLDESHESQQINHPYSPIKFTKRLETRQIK